MTQLKVIALVLAMLPTTALALEPDMVTVYNTTGLRADRLVVDKGERLLHVMQDGNIVRTYPVALGRDPVGPKQMQGDGRTPEGEYVIDWRNPNSRFYRSLRVSYPNSVDRQHAASLGVNPGGMIMIHGSPNITLTGDYGIRADWTEGCIAVSNMAMDELWEAVAEGTPIEIRP